MPRRRAKDAIALVLGVALMAVIVVGRPKGAAGVSLLAGALAGALLSGFQARDAAARTRLRSWLVLVLLLLPTLVHFHAGGGRLGGDGVNYYIYTRSLVKDHDLEFTNEYAHYELLDREDLRVPTRTGRRRSIFAVGPGLVGIPFFLLGEALARVEAALGQPVDLSGYGPLHMNAVALGSLLCGFLAVVLIHDLLRRHFRAGVALLAAILVWGATFLYWYMVHQPTMSHATSALGAALAVWLWERRRDGRSLGGFLLLGLVFGFAMCLRWQNGVLLLLPAWDLARHAWRERLPAVASLARQGLALGAGAFIGAVPQMAAWKYIYGEWLLRYPPHGADFLRLDHPFVLETLFSSRHGLLSWTPVFWLGYLGFLPLLRRRAFLAHPLLLPLVSMTYVNMCSGDWWAGGSFSIRRFDSLLPVLAFGFAAGLDFLRRFVSARPESALALLAAPFVLWNGAILAATWRGRIPIGTTVAFPRVAGAATQVVSDAVGSPTTWPASWIFAWREGLSPGQYDRLVGRYLFYRQNNMGGRVAMGSIDDAALLAEGWGEVQERGDAKGRVIASPARLLAPLDVPEDLRIVVRATALESPTTLTVAVNGHPVGGRGVLPTRTEAAVDAPKALWHRELNDVTLLPEGGRLFVEEVAFVRPGAPEPLKWVRPR